MTELRPIRMDEAPAFLRLLCDVFELDYGRASSVFTTEPMFDLNRKWALFEDGCMASVLTTSPLIFGWGRAIGIAGVATVEDRRGRGLAARLLEHVLAVAEREHEGPALLFAEDTRLYAELGFEVVDEVVRAAIRPSDWMLTEGDIPEGAWPATVPPRVVRKTYDRWAEGDPGRLRRDARRWNFWQWNLRSCDAIGAGYLCIEGAQVREAISPEPMDAWPVPPGTSWVGLRTLTEWLRPPVEEPEVGSLVMARGFPTAPAMFLTDQF